MAAQVMSLQAGYAFASTFDPNTQADSPVLVVFIQIAAGLLFFATGLDREVLHVFARSMETYPAGSFVLTRSAAMQILARWLYHVQHRITAGSYRSSPSLL